MTLCHLHCIIEDWFYLFSRADKNVSSEWDSFFVHYQQIIAFLDSYVRYYLHFLAISSHVVLILTLFSIHNWKGITVDLQCYSTQAMLQTAQLYYLQAARWPYSTTHGTTANILFILYENMNGNFYRRASFNAFFFLEYLHNNDLIWRLAKIKILKNKS